MVVPIPTELVVEKFHPVLEVSTTSNVPVKLEPPLITKLAAAATPDSGSIHTPGGSVSPSDPDSDVANQPASSVPHFDINYANELDRLRDRTEKAIEHIGVMTRHATQHMTLCYTQLHQLLADGIQAIQQQRDVSHTSGLEVIEQLANIMREFQHMARHFPSERVTSSTCA